MPTRDETAQMLADAHYQAEVGISQIFRIIGAADVEARSDEPIKLLEINCDTIAAGIMPIEFGAAPHHGIYFPTVIVEVTPSEFECIRRQELNLPSGWRVGELLARPSATAVA